MSLTLKQVDALHELDLVWPESNAVIIGATALGFYYDMTWRRTVDVDLVLALDRQDFPGALLARPGWKQHSTKEHEFTSPFGDKIDLLPASRELIAGGRLSWSSGHVMNLSGMDLAFDHAERRAVAGGYTVSVAPPHVVATLKMASYCDRPAERQRDLGDIAHLLESYVDDVSDRRWEEAGEQEFALVPAYLLGLDIGRIARTEAHRKIVEDFLDLVGDPDCSRHATMLRNGPYGWRHEDDALARRLGAFVSGIKSNERPKVPGSSP